MLDTSHFLSLAALGLLGACGSPASDDQRREMPFTMIEGAPMYDVVPLDGIPSIDEPVFVSADEATSFMADEEPVLGVIGRDGTAKAYSSWQLEGHEIVNDLIDGEPYAVTW